MTASPRGRAPATMRETERVSGQMGPGRGPHGGGMIGQKSMDFRGSARRLIAQLRPERARFAAVFAAAIAGVTLASIGPRVLGRATDLVFAGAVGRTFPAGMTKEQASRWSDPGETGRSPISSPASI